MVCMREGVYGNSGLSVKIFFTPETALKIEWNKKMGRGKGKLGWSERVAWTYIHYQM